MNAEDMRSRTFQFGIRRVKLAEALPRKSLSADIFARQLIRRGTSVGSNDRAALRARSHNEIFSIFISSIKTARTNAKKPFKK